MTNVILIDVSKVPEMLYYLIKVKEIGIWATYHKSNAKNYLNCFIFDLLKI